MKTIIRHIIFAGLFSSISAVQGANLVLNGSFETNTGTGSWTGSQNELGGNPTDKSSGTISSWSRSGRTWLYQDTGSSNFTNGSFAAAIDARSDVNGIDVLAQTGLSLTAGITYTLTFDIWGTGGVATPEALDARFTYGFANELDYTDGTGVTVIDEKTTVGNDGSAETVSIDFTPTVTDSNYALQFFMDGTGTTNNHLYIDNIQLVPEPSSSTLFALGLLSVLFRRSKKH